MLANHPAKEEITVLIDSRALSDELHEEANLLLYEVILELSLEGTLAEELNVGLTGQVAPEEWLAVQSFINFRVLIHHEDQQTILQPEVAEIPPIELPQIDQPAVYEPARSQSLQRWGNYFAAHQQIEAAVSYYTQYLSLNSQDGSTYLTISNLWLKANQIQSAIQVLKDGIEQIPAAQELYFWLIIRLKQNHAYSDARSIAQKAAALFPEDYTFKLLSHLMLPEIYRTTQEIEDYRSSFQQGLNQLIQGANLSNPSQVKQALTGLRRHTNFFLAYQGNNDVQLQHQYGQFLHQVMAANYPEWIEKPSMPPVGDSHRIKIGFLSSFLCGWSGTVLFLNWLKFINREEFEIYSYHIGDQVDGFTELFQTYSTNFHHISANLETVCQQVIDDRLHLLIFPELGMDATTLCIAGLRLAPIQCMAWGQPVTSGLPTIDYFLSSEMMEPANGQEHYTETLVRLPGVGISYPAIEVTNPQRDRASFGLREDAIVYISSQAPYKYLPQHDYIYASIARQVPNAQFMFLRAGIPQERLEQAFAAAGLKSQDYCVFSPVLPRNDYFDLLSVADIYLDTLDWSGGNTTLDAISCHLPIVTCPGELMRGRHTYGFLQAMGVTDTIAADPAQYIALAIRLATDLQWRNSIREAMKRSASGLFDNPEATRNLEAFLKQAIATSI